MRVLQVVTDNDRRGAQSFAVDLQQSLVALGWQVETVALAPGRVGGLSIPTLGHRRRSPATIWALRKAARRADVVVAHGSTTLPATALALLGLARPFVYRQISDSLHWAPTHVSRARVRAGLSRAERIVALWDGAAGTLMEHFGVPADKLRIVPNGVRVSDWSLPSDEDRRRARRALGLSLDRPVVAFVGALAREKGPDLAVKTMSAMPDAHLLVVGAGPEERMTRSLATRLLDGRVTFVATTDNMRGVYAATDVLLLPSRSDSMPAVVIEAGLMGVPTVAADVGALRAMLQSGVTGEVVAAPDPTSLAGAVGHLLREPSRREAMGAAARDAFLKRFDLAIVAQQWSEVLEAVIDRRLLRSESGKRVAEL